MERGLGGEDCGHSVGAVYRCSDFTDAHRAMDKAGHEIRAQKKIAVSSFVDDGRGFKRLVRRNTSVGAPNDVLSIRVTVSPRRC
jgi:hypothetical protein